jgi:hypothetical protein
MNYYVKDKMGRNWGKLTVLRSHGKEIHGTLKPTSEYAAVKPIFASHEAAFNDPGGNTEETAKRLADL